MKVLILKYSEKMKKKLCNVLFSVKFRDGSLKLLTLVSQARAGRVSVSAGEFDWTDRREELGRS